MAQKIDYAALKKGGYMRQKQKGYGSLRLAVIGGNLTAENIKKVAEVAEKYGRGYVHMTSRQGIEIPFIKVEELAEVKEELAKGGVGTGVCGPRVRTITACQGSEVDAWEGTPGYIVSFGGTFGNNIYKGEELLPLIPDKETLFRVTDAAITFFEKNASPSERFRKTLQRVGEEDFRKQLKEAYEGQ